MTLRQVGDRLFVAVCAVVLLPARVVEETTHAIAAWPFAEAVYVDLNPWGNVAETQVQFREGTPRWAITVAHVAPELIAAVTGAVVLAWWLAGPGVGWWPESTLDWALLYFVGIQYLAIWAPEQGAVGAEVTDG
jgi:hypothetical protein